jgi:FtsZ-interacting cell division protein ZipA
VPDISTVQIIGGAAAVIVIVLVLTALVVSRRRRARQIEDEPSASFLSSTPHDTFAGLGASERSAESGVDGLGLDRTQTSAADEDEITLGGAERADDRERSRAGVLETDVADSATEAEEQSEAAEPGAQPEKETEAADDTDATADEDLAQGEAGAEPPSAPRPRRMVALSEIIVTTNQKLVDLDDAEVRRMLTDLVRYEIDQAAEFSAAGQSVDAVLQLTEAEKVSRALDMDETAQRIRTMMRELQD